MTDSCVCIHNYNDMYIPWSRVIRRISLIGTYSLLGADSTLVPGKRCSLPETLPFSYPSEWKTTIFELKHASYLRNVIIIICAIRRISLIGAYFLPVEL